jgi:hydroxymethylpyrimidine pyrophosphatase-like HAD family hydrolase
LSKTYKAVISDLDGTLLNRHEHMSLSFGAFLTDMRGD